MARESDLQNWRQFSFRLHDVEQAFRNLFRSTHAGFAALRFSDPLGDVVPRGVIQFVIPAPQRASFAKKTLARMRLSSSGIFYGPFFAVEFNLKMGDASLRRLALLFASAY